MTAKVCILVIGILANVVLVTSCGGVDLLRCTLLCCYKKKCQIDDIGDLLDCCCPQGDGGKRSLDEYDMTESSQTPRSPGLLRQSRGRDKLNDQVKLDTLEKFMNRRLNPKKDSYIYIGFHYVPKRGEPIDSSLMLS
ncbi:unnamed protein product [Owenia fusiformis]|uniref:Uncharacterized protein n=1 Tax=Owenia fusiformis TaxID=6347 RepID=A0A8J1TZH3_OWEFU|nr:unnamed protein product [Owenia fusiformis]